MRQDILEDLYKAIDQFAISLELCDKVSELRFGDATFLAKDRAMLFMRYMRKHIAALKENGE